MFLMTVFAVSLATTALAGIQQGVLGFNYGATNEDGSCRGYHDFVRYFQHAKTLASTEGRNFTSARLYTSIQCGNTTRAEPISAYKAAIDTNTSILVGLWASSGNDHYTEELISLSMANIMHGDAFVKLIIGISVGSEDLYRSTTGGQGADAGEIVGYIKRLETYIRNNLPSWKPIQIGHVDTYTAWIRPENAAVVKAVKWLGHNSFPYWESDKQNSIENATNLFASALNQTRQVAAQNLSACGEEKEVWVTETGWPHAGKSQGDAVASVENAQIYWVNVGCDLFQTSLNIFWYTLLDSNADQFSQGIEFGLTRNSDISRPVFNLRCPSVPGFTTGECGCWYSYHRDGSNRG
ncbi:glycoside hydrolase superfamily [Colletotrichum godetiae]|uniref:Probable glucan endo-1,3-beta-glucosidase eglC n=1 Tax=Colletotrichum godetiae TaxID=1209918 RepID=A0AAJ0EMA4_9PEZI|nr:glycoside hydrolase superfamily [Colletotrichum godetiae]KAK1657241.1 glycoside hydrolase superfamily [Colletotrichum godetiae]